MQTHTRTHAHTDMDTCTRTLTTLTLRPHSTQLEIYRRKACDRSQWQLSQDPGGLRMGITAAEGDGDGSVGVGVRRVGLTSSHLCFLYVPLSPVHSDIQKESNHSKDP